MVVYAVRVERLSMARFFVFRIVLRYILVDSKGINKFLEN